MKISGLTDEDKQVIQLIEMDLRNTEQEIASTKAESEKYGKSLVKSLLDERLGILNITADLLKQRLYGIKAGARPNVTTNISKTDPDKAKLLEKDIEKQMTVVESSKLDADHYGGLVGALHSSRLATEQQSLAMLRLQYFSSKYGLPAINTVKSSVSSSDCSSSAAEAAHSEEFITSPQDKEKQAKKEASYIEMCKNLSSFAKTVKEKRQDEIPMHKTLKDARSSQSAEAIKALEKIVSQAYYEIVMLTPENRIIQQNEFSNKVFKECYDNK